MESPAAVSAAWTGWVLVFVAVSALILAGQERTVLTAYRDASIDWFSGRDIYAATGQGFLYLPSAAVLFAPYAQLPTPVGEIAWRMLMIGAFAFGVWRLSSVVEVAWAAPGSPVDRAALGRPFVHFPLITLTSLFPALSCARNGQATLIMTAMMMLATADLIDRRPGRATLWMSLGLAFKPLILVMLGLTAAFDRRMAWRLCLGGAAVLLFPFLTQDPHYVARQYLRCIDMLRAASHGGVVELFSQPFSILSLLGVSVSESVQTLIRVMAGLGFLGLCREARRRRDPAQAVAFLFGFSVLFILLFSPRTENNTYAMLGPVIGYFAASALGTSRRGVDLALLTTALVALVAGNEAIRLVAPHARTIWLDPIIGATVLGFLVYRLFSSDGARRRLAPLGVLHAQVSGSYPDYGRAGTPPARKAIATAPVAAASGDSAIDPYD